MAFVCRVSRSETSGAIPSSHSSNVQVVSEYLKDELLCEGSELCFEEVRAAKYFRKLEEQQEEQQEDQTSDVMFAEEQFMRSAEENFMNMRQTLEKIKQELEVVGGVNSHAVQTAVVESSAAMNMNSTQHSSERPHLSSRRSSRRLLGLRLHTEPTFIHEALAVMPGQYQEERDVTAAYHDETLCSPVLPNRSVQLPAAAEPSPVLQVAAAEQVAPLLREGSPENGLLQGDPETNTTTTQ